MSIREALVAAFLATTPIAAQSPSSPNPLEVQRFGVYVLVDDVDRSVAYYERLFGEPPQIRTAALVGFDIAGGLFGIVDRQRYGQGVVPGSSARPYIRVKDLNSVYQRTSRLDGTLIEPPGIVGEGPFRFFRFSDPDGNIIEFFSIAGSS